MTQIYVCGAVVDITHANEKRREELGHYSNETMMMNFISIIIIIKSWQESGDLITIVMNEEIKIKTWRKKRRPIDGWMMKERTNERVGALVTRLHFYDQTRCFYRYLSITRLNIDLQFDDELMCLSLASSLPSFVRSLVRLINLFV